MRPKIFIKSYLHLHLVIWDLQTLRYFLGIYFIYHPFKLPLSQHKCDLDLLEETRLLGCKQESLSMEDGPKLWDTNSPLLEESKKNQCLLWMLIYLIVISAPHFSSTNHLVDTITKSLRSISYDFSGIKLGMFYLHTPSWGGGSEYAPIWPSLFRVYPITFSSLHKNYSSTLYIHVCISVSLKKNSTLCFFLEKFLEKH